MPFLKITSKMRHCLNLLSYLAQQKDSDRFVSLSEIARHHNISQGYLEEIASDLKQNSLIAGRKGSGGGYKIAKPASRIYLLEVFNAIKDSPVSLDCLDAKTDFDCLIDNNLASRNLWASLNGIILAKLSSTTLDDVLKKSKKGGSADFKFQYKFS